MMSYVGVIYHPAATAADDCSLLTNVAVSQMEGAALRTNVLGCAVHLHDSEVQQAAVDCLQGHMTVTSTAPSD